MNDQEQIDAYLKANPLKKSQKNMDRTWLAPCQCGNRVNHTKKRPVTTFSGTMNSVYTDVVNDFPKHEYEDLCPICQDAIRFSNSDQNGVVGNLSNWGKVSERVGGDDVDLYTDSIDAEYLRTAKEYEGYQSYEDLEGTAYKLGQKDGEI